MVAQAAVGYTQYFNGDPAGLVALHVAGASVLVVAMLRFYLGLAAYPQTERGSAAPSRRPGAVVPPRAPPDRHAD